MIITYKFSSIEELFEKIHHVDSKDMQLKRGIYSSKFSQVISGNNMIHHVATNISTSCEGASHENFYMLILVTSKDKQIFRGCSLDDTSIIIIEPMTEYNKLSFGANTTLVVYVPKQKIEERFGSLPTGIYNVKNKGDIDLLLYLSSKLFNSQQLNNHFIEYYSAAIIEKMQASLVNIHNLCNNCKRCNQCIEFYEIERFMKKEYKNNLEIAEIAEYFNITDRTLRNIFSRQVGISPKQYQKSLQMNYLKQEIIKNPYSTISDIIINQGMSLQSFVSKEFKSYFQTTPNKFKKYYFNNF